MPVVSFVSQKGGVGKSTLARALAREAAAAGLAVKIADLDTEQGTAADWARRRLQAGFEPVVPAEVLGTAAAAFKIAHLFDLLVIDGPARASAGTLAIAKGSALVVQPAGTSLDDLRPAIVLFNTLVEKGGIPKERLAIALVRVGTEGEEADARDYLARHDLEVLPGALPERPAYRMAQNNGQAITEVKFKGLSERAELLVQSIADRAKL